MVRQERDGQRVSRRSERKEAKKRTRLSRKKSARSASRRRTPRRGKLKIVARTGGSPRGSSAGLFSRSRRRQTCLIRPVAPPAVVVVGARAPHALNGAPHRRSRDRAHAPVDFALLIESPLLVLVDAPVDGGLHRRTGERARDAERGHADGSRRAPLRSEKETCASPRAGRVRLKALELCRLCIFRATVVNRRIPRIPVWTVDSCLAKNPEEFFTRRCSPPRCPHSCARRRAPLHACPAPTEALHSVRGRLRPGRSAVRAKHQGGIRRVRWATKTPSCPWART